MTRLALVLTLLLPLAPSEALAGWNDPWWLHYTVQGGSRIYERGPYRTKADCMGARLRLPVGARFLRCVQ